MRQARELLRGMVDRYAGHPKAPHEMRADDARQVPAGVHEQHHAVRDEHIAGVHCTWLDPHLAGEGVVVSLHGGGYWVGPGPAHWNWFSALCRQSARAGLLIRYSRAPEATYPVAVDEAQAVVRTLTGPWTLVGDSAGGGLGLALAQRLRDAGLPMPRGMVLSSPWLDTTLTHPEMLANQHIDPMMGVEALDAYAAGYAGDADRTHPELSPLFADPAGLPPMLVVAGTHEVFVWEIRDWVAKCRAAGTTCDYIEVEGAVHDFAIMLTLFPEARDVLPAQVEFIRAH